jgi:DNA (cytosine-5)-methyltransferase 1
MKDQVKNQNNAPLAVILQRGVRPRVDCEEVLNLYAGVGGNRKDWEGCHVTAVESNEKIAAVYARQHPNDTVIVGDAHKYLIENHSNFDFIWSSPPCQTHSKMNKATRHKTRRYPDMKLYEEIIFLQHFFKGPWIVENVVPYYEPLIEAKKIGRHLFWSNFAFEAEDVARPKGFINKTNVAGALALMEWLGIHYEGNLYYGGNHCPAQILRNCVHPKLGKQIFDAMRKAA